MLLRHAIGNVVRRLRRERLKTLQQLSAEASVSLPYLSEIERGRKEVSSEVLATICGALDVRMDAFLHEVSSVLAEDASRTVLELSPVRRERAASRSTEMLLAA